MRTADRILIRFACASTITTLASSPLPAQAGVCLDGKWTEPIELRTADRRPVYIEPAPVTRFGKKFVALASPSWIWRTPTEFMTLELDTAGIRGGKLAMPWNLSRGGFVFDRAGQATPLDQPPEGKWIVRPRLFEVDSVTITAVWAQDTAWNHNFDTHRIWSARLRNGKWEKPEPRSTLQSRMQWLGDVSTHARAKIPAYAATVFDANTAHTLAGVYSGDRWYETRFAMRMLNPSVHAAGLRDGVATMFVGSAFGRIGVAMLRFRISGDSMVADPPLFLDTDKGTPLKGSNGRQFTYSHWDGMVTGLDGDTLLAVWTYESPATGGKSLLRTEFSRDGGFSWTRRLAFDLGEKADDLQLIISGTGEVHLIYRSQPTRVLGGEGSLRHLMLRGDRWHRITSLDDQIVSSRLGSGASDDGLVLFWTRSSVQYGLQVPRTVVSWWSPEC